MIRVAKKDIGLVKYNSKPVRNLILNTPWYQGEIYWACNVDIQTTFKSTKSSSSYTHRYEFIVTNRLRLPFLNLIIVVYGSDGKQVRSHNVSFDVTKPNTNILTFNYSKSTKNATENFTFSLKNTNYTKLPLINKVYEDLRINASSF